MIVPNLKGGLGNQMFQIAAAAGAAHNNQTEFGIDCRPIHNLIQGKRASEYKDNLYSNILAADVLHHDLEVYHEPHFRFSPIPKIPNNTSLLIDGYFQSSKYFAFISDDIKSLWAWPDAVVSKVDTALQNLREKYDHIIGYHIRRGDYIRYQTVHPLQSIDYYNSAIESLNVGTNSVVKLLCTDDINSVEKEFNLDDFIWVNDNEISNMYLLSQCDSVIMSNSSFSWWGAWLGREKKVVAPKNWFGPDGPQDFWDIYEPNWTVI